MCFSIFAYFVIHGFFSFNPNIVLFYYFRRIDKKSPLKSQEENSKFL